MCVCMFNSLKISHHCAVLCIYSSHISMLMVTARLGALDKAMGRKGMERDRNHSLFECCLEGKGTLFPPIIVTLFRVSSIDELKQKSSLKTDGKN